MGNSEVGHMNLGAGRIVYQDLTRIDAAIEDGSFFDNPELRAACAAAKAGDKTLHVMGLLSPGGVHSHERHIFAMLQLAHREQVAARRGACVPRRPRHAAAFGAAEPGRVAGRMRRARQRAHRQHRRPLLRDGSRPALGTVAPRLGCDRQRAVGVPRAGCAFRAGGGVCARRERRVRRADRDQRRAAIRRRRRGGVHEFPRRPCAPARGRVRRAGLPRLRCAPPAAVPLRLPERIRRDLAGAGRLPAGQSRAHARRTAGRTRPEPAAHRRDREIRARHLLLQRRPRSSRIRASSASWSRARRSRPTTCSRK